MSAADKPAWIIDYKKLNLPEMLHEQKEVGEVNPFYKIHFTHDDKVLISFWEQRPQTKLATKDAPENSGKIFVALLLSIETGELIRRVEWSIAYDAVPSLHFISNRFCIYPLPSGGFVGITNRHLRVFDSSFNVIHDRVLDAIKDRYGRYEIIVPLYGQYFILQTIDTENRSISHKSYVITEIIDTKTFKTVERMDNLWHMVNIWEDRILETLCPAGINERRVVEKKIGAPQWNDLGLIMTTSAEAKFIYNGTIIVTDVIKQIPFWFKIENGKKSATVFKGIIDGLGFKPSRNTPTIALEINLQSDFQKALDISGKCRIEAYDLNTQKTLLETKKYSNIVNYAISPNGDSVALIIKNKKIELYNVKPQNDKKK